MKQQTLSKKEERLAQLRAMKILRYSQSNKQGEKRDRLIQRIAAKAGRTRVHKPARKDRVEIVARQKKERAPYGFEG